MNKKIRFSLLTLLVMLCGTVFADYQKVTATSDITDGEYLIVYEGGNVAFDGSLTTLDAASNTVAVTISDNKIASTEAIDAATFTIDATKGTIKSSSDKYIGITSNNNGLTASDSELTNTLSIDEGGNFTVLSSGGAYLRYNSADNQKRFRYYKSASYTNQNAIQLYKKIPAAPSGYIVDFNTAISTSSHDFVVASNWGHIVGSNNYDNYGPYYMQYSYTSDGGIDESGALRVMAQNGYYAGSPQSQADFTDGHYDYLITPKVNGTVTLQVKRYNVTGYPSYVKIFKVNDAGTTVGEELTTEITPEITPTEWSTLTLTLTEEQRLAIRAQSVLLDNFTATSANIVKMPAMSIASISRADGESSTYFDGNADGSYTVKYKVKITNTGEVDLVSGTTENYSLSVSIDGALYGSYAIPFDLAVGETSEEFVASIVLPSTAPKGWKNRYLTENLSGTTNTNSLTWSQVLDYNPIAYFIKKGDEPIGKGKNLESVSSVNFGMISAETALDYVIFANNAGDLQIKSIDAPEGFSVQPAQTLPYTIAAHTGMDVTVTANGVATAEGNLVITYVNKNGNDSTQVVALSQTVIDASKWLADFSENVWPENTIHQSSLSIASSTYYGYDCAVKSSSSYNNKFISPKLHATAGEAFRFDAMLDYNSGTVKVYLTNDRSVLGDPVLSLNNTQLNMSNMTTQSFTAEAEGDYYVVFEIYNAFIDNLFGFEPVAVTHDIMVNSFVLSGSSAEDKTIQKGDAISPKFEILPVKAETADAYTVKLYANNEVVATAESADLVGGTAKSFTFSYTPEVTATTTFNVYAAIEFTDETVIKSDSLKLTVTCEPVFIFFNAGTTVYSYKPSTRTNPITFGKVNEANLVQNFEIYNWGTAPLTVSSITVPEGFTVNVSEATVQPKERQAVDVTFAATTPGIYSGNLAIVYTDAEGEHTFELPVSGTLLDATKFYATFGTSSDLSNLPAGSLVQDNVSLSTPSSGNAALVSSNSIKNLFITPLLSVTEGEKLTFEARVRSSWYDGDVKVYLVSDHVAAASTTNDDEFAALNPVLVDEFAISSSSSNFSTYTVTMPSTGNFYVAFKIKDAYVDEVYGLTPVATPAELMLVSSNIPTEAMQNVAKTVSVNILNIGQQAEAADGYTMTVFVDGAAVATGETVALPMNHKLTDAGTQITASFRYPKIGTFPVYVEVKAGEYSVATEPVNVTFTEEIAKNDIAMETGNTSATNLLHMNWNNSETVNLYSKSVLADLGLTAGAKIQSISFKGYNIGSKNYSSALNVWYEFTDDETQTSPSAGKYDTSSMTNALSIDERSWASKEGASDDLVDLITINFAEPVVYNGKSLRIVVSSEATNYQNGTNFVQSKVSGTNTSYYNRNDTYNTYANTQSWVANNYLPAIYIGLAANNAVFSGTVKTDTGAAVEGATITLVSTDGDNVQYTGATDAEGAYSINVIQSSRTYDVTMKAEGYDDQVVTIEFNGESQTKDFVVASGSSFDPTTAIANADFEGEFTVYSSPNTDRDIHQPGGWTINYENSNENDMTALNSSCKAWDNFSGRPQLTTGGNNTYWVRFRWGNNENLTMSQVVTLPAGEYRMTADAFFNGANGGSATISAAGVSTSVAGNSTWGKYNVDFTLTEETAVTIAFNVKQTQTVENVAAFDNFKLGYLADVVKVTLQEEIATAEGMLADASKTEGREELTAAINTAKTFLTSTSVAEVNQAITDLKAAEQAFRVANLPVQEGTYYVYNAYAKKFLSRGANYGTRAVADDFGLPFNLTVDMSNTTYKLQMVDNKVYYGDDYWMYADCSGDRVRSYSLEKVDGGFYLHNANRATATDNRMYVYMKDDADKWAIAGNAIVGDNVGDEAQTVWQFVTAEQRNEIIAANAAAQKTAAFTAAGIAEDATLEVADATELTFKTGSAWIFTSTAGNPTISDSGTELFQASGKFTQTVENLESGLYKVSIQAFYRGGSNADVAAAYAQGYDLNVSYLNANGTNVLLKGWASDRAADNNPNGPAEAASLFAQGKYLAEGYAFVGEDKTLNLSVVAPNKTGTGWFFAGNVKYAKVDEAVLAGDANLNGEVTASDAILAVSFALETETPSPKAFKAADVNASGNITVSDAVGIVNIALSEVTSEPSARGDVAENNALALNGNVLALANTTEFVAFQMDVTVAEGTQFRGVELTSRAAGLNVTYNRVADNTYRVVAFSVNKNAIEAGEGAICTFDIVGNKNVQVTNIEFADAAARAYALVLGETTRINGIAAGAAGAEYYSVGGVKSDKAQKGMNVVRTADGKVKKVLVK